MKRGRTPLKLSTGKTVGYITADCVAHIPVRRSRHFYRAMGGYSLDRAVFDKLREACSTIVFEDRESGVQSEVSVADFRQYAKEIDHGYGVKLVCHESRYKQPNDAPVQLGLFAGAA